MNVSGAHAVMIDLPSLALRREVARKIDIADADFLTDVAGRLGLSGMADLQGSLTITRLPGSVFDIRGQGAATVTHICGVTLDPFEASYDVSIEVTVTDKEPDWDAEEVELAADDLDAPEFIEGGQLDLTDLLIQELSLILPAHPRHPDAPADTVTAQAGSDDTPERDNPFAVLAQLKKSD